MTLLEKCNADVFKVILDIKQKSPVIGEKLISILQQYQYCGQMPMDDVMWFAAYLPVSIWDCKVHTFYLLFESKQTTQNP